jgi:hypothetical protein
MVISVCLLMPPEKHQLRWEEIDTLGGGILATWAGEDKTTKPIFYQISPSSFVLGPTLTIHTTTLDPFAKPKL